MFSTKYPGGPDLTPNAPECLSYIECLPAWWLFPSTNLSVTAEPPQDYFLNLLFQKEHFRISLHIQFFPLYHYVNAISLRYSWAQNLAYIKPAWERNHIDT